MILKVTSSNCTEGNLRAHYLVKFDNKRIIVPLSNCHFRVAKATLPHHFRDRKHTYQDLSSLLSGEYNSMNVNFFSYITTKSIGTECCVSGSEGCRMEQNLRSSDTELQIRIEPLRRARFLCFSQAFVLFFQTPL